MNSPNRLDKFEKRMHDDVLRIGGLLVDGFHYLALFAIGGTVVWSAVIEFLQMAGRRGASIEDILLLFIYLELGAMVGIYFKTRHLPVRYLIYIAITALARLLVDIISKEHKADLGILIVSGAILLLAFAALVVRFGSHKYPSITGRSVEQSSPNPSDPK